MFARKIKDKCERGKQKRSKCVGDFIIVKLYKKYDIIADYQNLKDKTSIYSLILFVNMYYRYNFLPLGCNLLKRIKHFNMSSTARFYYSY